MTEESRHELISRIFLEACELPADRQRSFVERACGSDSSMCNEVMGLLSFDDDASSEKDPESASEVTRSSGAAELLSETEKLAFEGAAPNQIGPYQILGVLGEGGMGMVYRARKEHPNREVALKVLRSGIASVALTRRFEREARLLARLTHPGIARLYDAGVVDDALTGTKTPWIAMELVDGEAIHVHASRARLSERERLDLVARVADAVDHAHEKGIIHRDLKPANILVSDGEPRVVDFGVGRLLDPTDDGSEQLDNTVFTQTGQVVGTLPYMSPEQAAGRSEAIDARTDVYALGILAYELLAGARPIDVSGLSLAEAAHHIETHEPVSLGRIDASYEGDLETIVNMAIAKEPLRRYSSASAFAADIRRFLAEEPIAARPASTFYRMSKLARRHRTAVAAGSIVLLTLIGATVVSVLLLMKSLTAEETASNRAEDLVISNAELKRARAAAEESAGRATSINEFLRRILDAADPFGLGAGTSPAEVTLSNVLNRAVQWVDESFPDQPLAQAEARIVIGSALKGLGRIDDARAQLETALAQFSNAGATSLETIEAERLLAILDAEVGHIDKAEEAFRSILARQEAADAPELDRIRTQSDLVWALHRTRPADIKDLALQVNARYRELLGPDAEQLGYGSNNLASILLRTGDTARAKEMYLEAARIHAIYSGPNHPTTALILNNLGRVTQIEGDEEGAVALFQDAVNRMEISVTGPHPRLGDLWNNLASALHDLERFDESEEAYGRALEHYAAVHGIDHRDYAGTRNNLGFLFWDTKRFAEAEAAFQEFERYMTKQHGEDYWRVQTTRVTRAECIADTGDFETAEQMLLDAYRTLSASEGAQSTHTRRAAKGLSELYREAGREADAIRYEQLADEDS